MKKKWFSFILATTLLIPHAFAANSAEMVPPDVSAETRAQALIDTYGVTSIQYALMQDGEFVKSGSLGTYSKTENRELTEQTLYGIGSISKMFTTVAVMQLVDAGKIQLDTPVVTYLPEFEMTDARYKDITVRMLLNHSSGLMGSNLNNAFLYANTKDRSAYTSLLEDLKSQRLKADPGAFSVYCNDGFTLAEMLVEKVSGMSFTTYVHENITQPLKMEHTKTVMDDFDWKQVARTYDAKGQELPEEVTHVIGTGGIYSTAEDLCRFGQIFTGEQDILSKQSIEATFQPEYKRGQWLEDVESNAIAYGLGWDTVSQFPFAQSGIQAVQKGGDTTQMHAALVVLPEKRMTAAVVSAGGTSTGNTVIANQLLLEQLKKEGIEIQPTPSNPSPEPQKLDQDFSKYEGLYGNFGQLLRVFVDAEGNLNLVNAYFLTDVQKASYIGKGIFADESGLQYTFLEQNGNTYLVQEGNSTLPEVGGQYMKVYLAQKLEAHSLPEEEVWKARNGKLYLQVNGHYDSVSLSALPAAGIVIDAQNIGGYLVHTKVVDANRAETVIQIPMMHGRDVTDYTFFTQNGIEYMKANDGIFMDAEKVPSLYAGSNAHLTLPENGYGRWFQIPESLDGKQYKVTLPEDCGYALYDAQGVLQVQSVVHNPETITLQKGGYLYFAGTAGARIDLHLV